MKQDKSVDKKCSQCEYLQKSWREREREKERVRERDRERHKERES
jgi:hypothetical protein